MKRRGYRPCGLSAAVPSPPAGAGGSARSERGVRRGPTHAEPPSASQPLEATGVSAQSAHGFRAGPHHVTPSATPPAVRVTPPGPEGPAGTNPSPREQSGLPVRLQYERPLRDPHLHAWRELQACVAGGARVLRRVGHAPADPGQASDGALGDPLHARVGGRRRLQR